jgi:putative NADPH-quinone reductase
MKSHKNILVIIGHPSTKSTSSKLAHEYAAGAKKAGAHVEIVDVYRTEPLLPIIDYDDYPDWARDTETRKYYQDKLAAADTIAVFHPLWWGGMPARMKNFIDQTLTPGFAYKFQPRFGVPDSLNVLPRGYLKGKKARIFITHDAYSAVYAALLLPFISIWAIFVLYYCGITNMRFMTHQRVRWAKESTKAKWLRRAHAMGEKAGK